MVVSSVTWGSTSVPSQVSSGSSISSVSFLNLLWRCRFFFCGIVVVVVVVSVVTGFSLSLAMTLVVVVNVAVVAVACVAVLISVACAVTVTVVVVLILAGGAGNSTTEGLRLLLPGSSGEYVGEVGESCTDSAGEYVGEVGESFVGDGGLRGLFSVSKE